MNFYMCLSYQLLTICEMEPVKQGGDYKRCSGFVEIEVLRTDKYDEVTMKISDCLGLSLQENESYALFKMNGARILDKDLSVHGKQKPWLIGNYLSHVKKSAAQLKLGIGIIQEKLVCFFKAAGMHFMCMVFLVLHYLE